MLQYFDVKKRHPDAILLFRVGDFYETFGEDAITVSRVLGIVLTSRNNGGSDIELAGFPYHSLEVYLPKIVRAGFRVAICEQLEKPSKEKKIVKRDVTEIVTPGVTLNASLLDSKSNNFLASICIHEGRHGIAFLDISTGEFLVHQGNLSSISKLIQSLKPSEIIFSKANKESISDLVDADTYQFPMDEWHYDVQYNYDLLCRQFDVLTLKGLGVEDFESIQVAAGVLLHYLSTVQKGSISHIQKLTRIETDKYMWLDRFTIRNLELISSNHASGVSLLDTIDRTVSPMGGRLLNKWVILPLKEKEKIKQRLACVDFFRTNDKAEDEVRSLLASIGDLERLASKIPLRKINPKEFISISEAIGTIEKVKVTLSESDNLQLSSYADSLVPTHDLKSLILETIAEDAPYSLKKGNYIVDGCNAELDELRNISNNSKELLLDIQALESQKTGISNLKIGYNNVFGYYLEVTNKYKDHDLIPDSWVRKQTLKNAERYITSELKELEQKILQAQHKIEELELKIFEDLLDKAEVQVGALLDNSRVIAEIDCLRSLGQVALENNYCQPIIDDSLIIDIKAGRHPVIEKQLPPDQPFVANDTYLDNESQQIIMITGPNMSGKSAVLRQTALITLMAHMGSFVPADECRIGIVDKIFTRVGASDNISSGESTFMVEMNETASILNNLSNRSLILLDEIGRGTSTYDGISIAWSIAEYLHEHKTYHPKTLFATHYHELNLLEEQFERIKNYNVATKEVEDKIIFLRKLVTGSCASSFGIHVAQLAGMPKNLVSNAKGLLKELESKALKSDRVNFKEKVDAHLQNQQLQMFSNSFSNQVSEEIRSAIDELDLSTMTPIECMLKLKELQELLTKKPTSN